MGSTLDIYITDLTPEAQKEVLAFLGCKTPSDGNFDVLPLFTLESNEEDEEDEEDEDDE